MIFLVTLIAFVTIVAAMAVGVMAGRAPIKGSCGGVGRLGIDQKCDLCGGDPQVCETETRRVGSGEPAVKSYDPRD